MSLASRIDRHALRRANRPTFVPAAFWLGWLALCGLQWMLTRDAVVTDLMGWLGFPALAIMACIHAIRAVSRRRWAVLSSVLLGPLLCASVLALVANRTIDLDRLHFLAVESLHAHTLRAPSGDATAVVRWDWGIVGPLEGPGTAYHLVFDATGRALLQQQADEGPSLFARPMGKGFYLVAEAEDDGNVCTQLGDLASVLRRDIFGPMGIGDAPRRACELQVAASIRRAAAEGFHAHTALQPGAAL